MSKPIAIVAGVGPGTGASIAHRFSTEYPVVLLSRNSDNYNPTVEAIKKNGGKAIGVSTDLTSATSIQETLKKVKQEYGEDVTVRAAIFNANGAFSRKPFLEITEKEWDEGYTSSIKAAYNFSSAVLPLLSASKEKAADAKHPPTLVFTGATASVKGSANFSLFASTKFAIRALSQSLAREYGPKGVHVAHAVIDGVIDIPRTKGWELPEGGKIDPGAIAETYWGLHVQPATALTWEVDIRPSVEKW